MAVDISGSVFVTWPTPARAHAAQRIDIVVRIDFVIEDEAAAPMQDYRRASLPTMVAAAADRWSTQRFRCYPVTVRIDYRIVHDRSSVRPDALDVLLRENLPGYFQTASSGPDVDKSTSDSPDDAVVPKRGSAWWGGESIWGIDNNLSAHELGHVLGLGDGYTGSGTATTIVPGHPHDIMADCHLAVLPETVARMVRRHYGPDFEKEMHCPLGVRIGPSRFDLLIASLDDIRLDAVADRYDPPGTADAEPATFSGTFHVAGEYLTRFDLPWSASGESTQPVTFDVDLARTPATLRIDLGFWVLTQTLRWDDATALPYSEGPLLITVSGGELDSARIFPGPPLAPVFYDPRAVS